MLPIKRGEIVWVLFPDRAPRSPLETPATTAGVSASSKMRQGEDGDTRMIGDVVDAVRTQTAGDPIFLRAYVTDVIKSVGSVGVDGSLDYPYKTVQENGGFWVSRVVGSRLSEDLNFTHLDRDLDLRPAASTLAQLPIKDVLGDEGEYDPSFPNGPTPPIMPGSETSIEEWQAQKGEFTLSGGPTVYHDNKVLSPGSHAEEPVPLPRKSSDGDLVLHGSNNTRITLGTSAMGSVVQDDEPGGAEPSGLIVLETGYGMEGLIGRANEALSFEQEKCPELNEELLKNRELYEKWITGDSSFPSRSKISLSSRITSDFINYINGADSEQTFPSTAKNAGVAFFPRNVHQNGEPLEEFGDFNSNSVFGSSLVLRSDNVRIGGRHTLRIGVDAPDASSVAIGGRGGAEIILHKDGNIFIKPGRGGKVFIGGGPTELKDETAVHDEDDGSNMPGVATYCDMVCYADGKDADPSTEGGAGIALAAEMANILKLPTASPITGKRHSSTVKVKT